jgi:hypothetical protein
MARHSSQCRWSHRDTVLAPNKPVGPTQGCLASIFQNPDARQADLAAMRVSGKCQMGSAWYVREPHRIVRKYNARPFGYEAGQQLFRPSALSHEHSEYPRGQSNDF